MKNPISILLLFSLLFFNSTSSSEDISAKAEKLNSQAINDIGVSLRALSILIEYSNIQFSEDYMRSLGKWDSFEEVISSGLATVEAQPSIEGLEGQTFTKLIPTKTGEIILNAFN